eukprot:3163547-Ditylum_brightwellii.AAC.1
MMVSVWQFHNPLMLKSPLNSPSSSPFLRVITHTGCIANRSGRTGLRADHTEFVPELIVSR